MGFDMTTARIFKSGNSQVVRLPKEFRFQSDEVEIFRRGDEVEIFRRGDEVVLREKPRDMSRAFELLTELPDDFFAQGRNDPPPQSRDDL